ncbi:MAG: putative sigma-54 modulation protein [Patescibacteria group bacterium]|jgi:putative sigma-54 modulation protein|nr:putative sigma-54 modulation protein [Patescibacteria group bacterium]
MLNKHIKATNIELTEAIRDYAEKKVDTLNKFIEKEKESLAEIEVGKTTNHHNKGEIFRAEINLTMGDKQFRAVSETTDLYSAIDEMRDQIVREVKNHKSKSRALFRKGHQKVKDIMKGFRDRF